MLYHFISNKFYITLINHKQDIYFPTISHLFDLMQALIILFHLGAKTFEYIVRYTNIQEKRERYDTFYKALKYIHFLSECQNKYFIVKLAPLLKPLMLFKMKVYNLKRWFLAQRVKKLILE